MEGMKSKTRYKRLKAIFPPADTELSPILARMSVLYEDLRIEYLGATSPDELPLLDVLPSIYRKFYFLRRSTVTLTEFAGAFQYLQQRPEFKPIRKDFPAEQEELWKAAAQFFDKDGPEFEKLKWFRNAFGAHFKLSTVRAVLDRIDTDLIASLEIVSSDAERVAGPRLPYVFDLIATVIAMDRPPTPEGENETEAIHLHARKVFELITDGWLHAVNAMHVIVANHISPLFT
jgi:hypothetical protein